MSDTQIQPGTRPYTTADLSNGRIADPSRLVLVVPLVEPGPLPAGTSHLILPEWSPKAGPAAFNILGDGGGGSILSGMGVALADAIEFPAIIAGMIAVLVNISSNLVVTSPNDAGSPAGYRFAARIQISASQARMFIAAKQGGEMKWFPVGYQAPF